MEQVSISLKIAFVIVTLLTVLQFYRAAKHSRHFLPIIFIWMALQFLVGQSGFYMNTSTTPPRFILMVLPPAIGILFLFATIGGRRFLDSLNPSQLTLLHTTRIPVELVLYYLFTAHTIPEVMTFEGRNFDIIAGLSAPVILPGIYKKNYI